MLEDVNTYQGWISEGRAVVKGSTAPFYARLDEAWVALFDRDQTEDLMLVSRADLAGVEIITAEARKELKIAKPKVKVSFKDGWVKVWAGNNERAIRMLKKGGYKFNPTVYRWVAKRADPEMVVVGLKLAGFEVEATGIDVEETI